MSCIDAQLTLPNTAVSVSLGRRFVRETLQGWNLLHLADQVELVASELLTNAVLHAASAPRISMTCKGDVLRLEVADQSPNPPHPKHYDADASTGRGMVLVGSVSREWGSEPTPEGKIVWCEFDLSSDTAGAGH